MHQVVLLAGFLLSHINVPGGSGPLEAVLCLGAGKKVAMVAWALHSIPSFSEAVECVCLCITSACLKC